MYTLNIAICDDNHNDLQHLLKIINSCSIESHISTFKNGDDFLKSFKPETYDLIFMDIYMHGKNGIETIKSIRKKDSSVLVAFTTISTEHTLESYRLDAIKYLEKPVSSNHINNLLNLALLKAKEKPCLEIRHHGRDVAIPFDKIMYLEQQGRNLYIYTTNNNIYKTTEKLDNLENYFDKNLFIRCHKSFLVNLSYIKNLDKDLSIFVMHNNQNVHIRRESMSASKNAYENYLYNITRKGFNK